MKVVPYVVVAAALMFAVWRRARRSRRSGSTRPSAPTTGPAFTLPLPQGPMWLVAEREVRQRTRSRVFRVSTGITLLIVVAAIAIPVLRKGQHRHASVGVVGALSAPLRASAIATGTATGTPITLVSEPDLAAAEAAVRSGHLSLAIVDGQRILVKTGLSPTDSSSAALLARSIASVVSVQAGMEQAGLSPDQAARLVHRPPLPITSLEPPKRDQTTRVTATYGMILMYVLLTQYGTWILMGVVEEKSSRVVEVLLSTVQPRQLLAGKVLGIGGVALGQGLLLLAVSLGLAKAVGSDLVKGTAPVEVACVLVWLVLGYAFYCWVYAAGGSLADRQEHVQALAFPLQIPLLAGYLISLTALSSSNPSLFVKVLAYLPPTAPFAMSVLVAQNKVGWLGFTISCLLTIAATVGLARVAARIYQRAILQTGRRVPLRDVLKEPPLGRAEAARG